MRDIHETTTWTTSVCTGALVLGAAGILEGKRANTHWAYRDALREFGAEPVAERVVEDGKVVTAAGVSAGIDMALTLVGRMFDENVASAKAALAAASDADFAVPWSLLMGERVLFTMPRVGVVRQTINHLIHHRGQLTVYLRLVDVPLPSVYGPTADEGW